MPRFSDTEKEHIRQKLLSAGEKLFATQGLRKVTIDELAAAAHIAKATFYTFYSSKEYLYLDIVQGIQAAIFSDLNGLLASNISLPAKERVRQVFEKMAERMMQYPILVQIDTLAAERIARKVSPERMAAFYEQNVDAACALHSHGIDFICEVEVASMIFRALYRCFINMQTDGPKEQTLAINLMLDGILDKIVIG